MNKQIRMALSVCLTFLLTFSVVWSANAADNPPNATVTGTVYDTSGEPLPGVNVVVKGTIVGTPTESDGSFSISVSQDFPITLQFSIVGFKSKEIEVFEEDAAGLEVELEEQTIYGTDVVVSASRVEESILEAPVSIEKMDIIAVKTTASDDYYKSIGNLKGVDITTSSINFQIINARGFNSTGNTRMVQLTDGMDTQAPALNFPIGNLNGPNELDVESLEFIPGAASALYGPNAFNGILLVNSKNPFQYQGLSFMAKTGVNHLDGNANLGEPGSPQPMYTFAARYADAINDKFAYKFNLSYMTAEDWRGINYDDKNAALNTSGIANNPAFDGVHMFGDDGSFNIGLLGFNPAVRSQLAAGISAQSGGMIPAALAEQYVAALPSQPVNRTGYQEHTLIDYGAENFKANAALHYRITDKAELSYAFNYGFGTSIYTGAQRYSLRNFSIAQHKVQLEGDNFMVKAYGTFENSGDSYITDFAGFAVNEAYRSSTDWFGLYGATFAGGLLQAATTAQGGNPAFNQATVDAILSNPTALAQLHGAARAAADQGRLDPNSPGFNTAVDAALANTVPNGALFDDQSRFYHAEGQYDFKNEITFMDLQAGASFRQFQLRSNGTIFDDVGGVNINEWGAYLQGSKAFFEDRLKLTGSVRYDKNENFDGQINPRLSAVFEIADNQNIRASYQTGFRNPTTQGQFIDLNVITARLLGGLPQFAEKYNITENTYNIGAVEELVSTIVDDPSVLSDPARQIAAINSLEQGRYSTHNPVKPEQIQAFEVGYKGLLGNKLFIDAAYYYNIYNDFITQIRVRRAAGDINTNPATPADFATNAQLLASLLSGDFNNTFQIYTNNDEQVVAHGAVLGLEYSLPQGYKISGNYNYNELLSGLDNQFQNDFNTPMHKVNFSFGNREVIDNIGFNVTYRWQDAFRWESSFVNMDVPAVSTLDAQVTYNLPQYNASVKAGGSNITNQAMVLNGGGPSVGGIYYVSIVFDSLFR